MSVGSQIHPPIRDRMTVFLRISNKINLISEMKIEVSDIEEFGRVKDMKSIHWEFNDYIDISLDAAKLLKKSQGSILKLDGIKHLDKLKARAIADFKGDTIELPGLRGISPSTIGELASFKGKRLRIGVGSRLDEKMAMALASYEGYLELISIAEIDEKVIPLIHYGKFSRLALTQLSTIHPNQYAQLKNLGDRLDKITVTTLSRVVLEEKVPYNISEIKIIKPDVIEKKDLLDNIIKSDIILNFESLISLEYHTAEIISRSSCGVNLPKIAKLDAETCKLLALNKGPSIHLPSLKNICVKAAKELMPYSGNLYLDGINEIHIDLEKVLSKFAGSKISLNGLSKVSINSPLMILGERLCSEKLESLSGVELNSGVKINPKFLRKIDPIIAEWLALKYDFLDLSNLEEIDNESGAALARHKGNLIFLKNIKTIPGTLLEKKNGEIRLNVKSFDCYEKLDTEKHRAILEIAEEIMNNLIKTYEFHSDFISIYSNIHHDLGLDSLDMVEMIMECELYFDINFDDRDIEDSLSVLSFASVVHKKKLQNSGIDELSIIFVDK